MPVTSPPNPGSEVLCIGELLWDALPAGLFLGGAPFNVASHLHAAGVVATMVTRLGADQLGDEAYRRVASYGIRTDLLQVDPLLPTGFVRASVAQDGSASYHIVEPAAWDNLEVTRSLLERAATAKAVVFGTLGQRNAVARATVQRVLETRTLKVLGVNLRPPYDDREIVRDSLRRADVVRLTENEMRRLAAWFDLRGDLRECVAALVERFHCRTVCVTRGRNGAALWRDGRWVEHPGFDVEVRDASGTGDAFLAALLAGLLEGAEDQALLHRAHLAGAHVTTQHGALPQ